MPQRRTPRARTSARENSREEIVAAATRLFSECGLENVTFGQIAKAAKVSRPLVYFHFSDQRTLFLECVLQATAELSRRFHSQIDLDARGIDQLEQMGHAYFGLHEDEPAQFQVLAMYEAQPPADGKARELHERIEVIHREIDELKTGFVRRGIADGSIRADAGDPQSVSTCLWAFCHGLSQLIAVKGNHLCQCFGLDIPKTIETGFALLRRSLSGKRD